MKRKLKTFEETYQHFARIHERAEAQRAAALEKRERVGKILSARRREIVKDQRLVAMIEAIEAGQACARIPRL